MPDLPPGSSAARPSGPALAGWLAAALGLTAFLYAPLTGVMEPTLDASNYGSYAYFAAHHFQYGRDVVPMFGPLGFILPGSAYNGLLFWPRLAGQLVAAAGVAVVLLAFFHRARGTWLRWPWLALTLVLAPALPDMPYELAILLAGLLLLAPVRPLPAAAALALFAAFSLVKGTHLSLALATVALVAGFHFVRGRRLRALGLVAAYGATFLLCWILAGQSPRHLPGFLRGIFSLSSGYNAAMGLDEPAGVLARGLLALALLAAGLAWGAWRRRDDPAILAGALLLAGFSFVLWKHGFVRADGHVGIFHHFAALAASSWFLFAYAAPAPGRGPALVLLAAALPAALWLDSPELGPWRPLWPTITRPVAELRAGLAQLWHPARDRARLDAEWARQCERQALRLTAEDIGRDAVDLFGSRHGIIPLNGLNYRPRPMGGGSFNVYNPYLMGLNRDFLRDPARRPPWYLVSFEPLDHRLGPQEDGLALLELIARYRPVRREEGYLLLREVTGAAAPVLTPLGRQTFTLGGEVTVPAVPDSQLLVARFDLPSSLAGALRQFLYKPPTVTLSLQLRNEETLTRRLVPAMAASPFLFSPTLDDTADFARLYAPDPGKAVARFVVQPGSAWAFAATGTVEFWAMPRPAPARAPEVDELLDPAAAQIYSAVPETIEAADPRPLYLGKLPVQPLHAPGRLTWRLTGAEHELVFEHGLMPEAWERGHGNGVVFLVELESPGAPPQRLFERLVDPFTQAGERRTLRSRVPLPPHLPGSRLVLRTDPGAFGDTAWDWSYVTHLLIKPGLAPRGGTATANRVPVALAGNLPTPVVADAQPATLLHVPGAIAFPARPTDRQVTLGFGFLPGAYTGEGRTPGAAFVLESVADDGEVRELFRRELDPVARPADRGPQSAVVRLPAAASGRWQLRTTPLAGAGSSWGWTYFSRCDIE